MALWKCTGCTTRYAVGAPRCPWCGSREHVEDGEDMAKITVHGGVSDRHALPDEVADAEQPSAAPELEPEAAPKKTAARRKARPVKDTSEGVE